MNSNSCFVEEALSKRKEKEESESDDYCPEDPNPLNWPWLGSSAEDSVKDSLFKIENDFGEGEANNKRRKLELDPIPFNPFIDDSIWSYDGDCSSSAMEVDHQEEEENIKKYFQFRQWLRKRGTPLIQRPLYALTALEEDVPGILENLNVDENAPPEPYLSSCIVEQMIFDRAIFQENKKYEAVKHLYEHIPYITYRDPQVRKKIDLETIPFSYLEDAYIDQAVEIHGRLLRRTEKLFHPLIRKSLQKEFFKLVDIEAKCGQRDFIEDWGANFSPLEKKVLKDLSESTGLRDEEYVNCRKQIELQADFDYHLQYMCWWNDKLIKPDSVVEDLICDEEIVTEKFKELDTALLRLSLEACIKSQWWMKQHMQWNTFLELLYEKHRKEETVKIDKMLIEFCTKFPCILNFPLDKAFDSATEEGFKDIIVVMKKNYFPDIADHLVIEGTLLYMKSIFYESVDEPEPSWPIVYMLPRLNGSMTARRIIHEHPFYDRVYTVDYNLV
ncbi:uncharacterized protein LOC144550611 [Carex rostrata]